MLFDINRHRLVNLMIEWAQSHTIEAQNYPISESQWIIAYMWNTVCLQYRRNELITAQKLLQSTINIYHVLSELYKLESEKYKYMSDTNIVLTQAIHFDNAQNNTEKSSMTI